FDDGDGGEQTARVGYVLVPFVAVIERHGTVVQPFDTEVAVLFPVGDGNDIAFRIDRVGPLGRDGVGVFRKVGGVRVRLLFQKIHRAAVVLEEQGAVRVGQ